MWPPLTVDAGGLRSWVAQGRASSTICATSMSSPGHRGTANQVSGQVVFEALQQTAGRRAILRDREAFPLFVEAVKAIEPAVAQTVERVAKEVDAQTTDRLSDVIQRIFGRVLKELADLDNPMRAPGGFEPGAGGLLEHELTANTEGVPPEPRPDSAPDIAELLPPPIDPLAREADNETARPDHAGSNRLPTVAPDPTPGEARSRFDSELGIVFFNENHGDYLMVKESESMLLDYLATLVAKKYIVYNNPRASANELGEELVRMLVRVRRHLPRRS
jgi:hypothetical protein